MRRTHKGSYTLSLWLQLLLFLFFLMLAAIVVMSALLIGGAVVVKGNVETMMANPERLSQFASKVIPSSLISDAITSALPPSTFRDALLQALSDPRVQQTLQALLAAALFGSPPTPAKRFSEELFSFDDLSLVKRDEPTCRGVTDSDLCLRLRRTCFNLNECVIRRNVTVCQSVSRDTVGICNAL